MKRLGVSQKRAALLALKGRGEGVEAFAGFEEGKHPRADDGKFGKGGGSAKGEKSEKPKGAKKSTSEAPPKATADEVKRSKPMAVADLKPGDHVITDKGTKHTVTGELTDANRPGFSDGHKIVPLNHPFTRGAREPHPTVHGRQIVNVLREGAPEMNSARHISTVSHFRGSGEGPITFEASVSTFGASLASLTVPRDHPVTDLPDGRVVVDDMPIFAEAERPLNDSSYGVGWLKRAEAADKARRATGYEAPMHFDHHGEGVKPERAGAFAVKNTRLRFHDGRPLWVSFARLTFDNRAKYERYLHECPYRSVEISPEFPNEYNSLALLSSEAPFHRFPVPRHRETAPTSFAALPGGRVASLWRQEKKAMPAEAFETAAPVADKKPDDKKPDEKAAADPGNDVGARLDRIEACLMKLLEGTTDEAPAEVPGKPMLTSPTTAAAAQPGETFSAELAARDSLLKAQGERLATLERITQFSALTERLAPLYKSRGLALDTADLKRAVEAGQGEHFATLAEKLVNGIAPAKDRHRHERHEEPATSRDCPEVTAYAQKVDPDTLNRIRSFSAMWDGAKPGHIVRKHTKATFIARQLESA